MLKEGDVLEVPVTGSTSVNEVVELLSANKVYSVKHPTIKLEPAEKHLEALAVFLIVSAFDKLTTDGKIKAKHTGWNISRVESAGIKQMESAIKRFFDISIVVEHTRKAKAVNTLKRKDNFPLDEVFGIWKNSNITLDKIREAQWLRKK